jgi:hypothetical protein
MFPARFARFVTEWDFSITILREPIATTRLRHCLLPRLAVALTQRDEN